VYFDWWIGQPCIRPNLSRFAAFYYNASLKYGGHVGVINYKDFAFKNTPLSLISNAANSAIFGGFTGRPIPRSATNLGATSRTTPSNRRSS
jgi:hypothetical protein